MTDSNRIVLQFAVLAASFLSACTGMPASNQLPAEQSHQSVYLNGEISHYITGVKPGKKVFADAWAYLTENEDFLNATNKLEGLLKVASEDRLIIVTFEPNASTFHLSLNEGDTLSVWTNYNDYQVGGIHEFVREFSGDGDFLQGCKTLAAFNAVDSRRASIYSHANVLFVTAGLETNPQRSAVVTTGLRTDYGMIDADNTEFSVVARSCFVELDSLLEGS